MRLWRVIHGLEHRIATAFVHYKQLTSGIGRGVSVYADSHKSLTYCMEALSDPTPTFDLSEDSWLIIDNPNPLHNVVQTLDETQMCRVFLEIVLSVLLVFELDYETVRKATLQLLVKSR